MPQGQLEVKTGGLAYEIACPREVAIDWSHLVAELRREMGPTTIRYGRPGRRGGLARDARIVIRSCPPRLDIHP